MTRCLVWGYGVPTFKQPKGISAMTKSDPIFCNPSICFDNALAMGTLNRDPGHSEYVGNYMYMHSEINGNGRHVDSFKNSITRKYTFALRV